MIDKPLLRAAGPGIGCLLAALILLCAAPARGQGTNTSTGPAGLTNAGGTGGASSNFVSVVSTNRSGGTNQPPTKVATTWGQRLKQGGNTAIVQILVSVFGAGFIFERLARCRRKYLVPEGLADRARDLWKAGKFEELEKLPDKEPSTLARAIAFVARHRHASAADVSATAGELVSRELSIQHQKAYPLGVVATLEPLLGLLGMILGMIEAFETVALAGALGDPTALASGIAEALVTTGLGLATAIPFLALYHYFKTKTNAFGTMLEEEMTDLITEWLMRKEAFHAR